MPSATRLQTASPLQAYWHDKKAACWQGPTLELQEWPQLSAVLITGGGGELSIPQPLTKDGQVYLSDTPNRAVGEWPCCLWLAPGQWLVLANQIESDLIAQLQATLPDTYRVTAASSSRSVIEISGVAAKLLLNKGCGLNLSSSTFLVGHCAQTVFAQVDILIQKLSEQPRFRVLVNRGEADYLWRWLLHAASDLAPSANAAPI
jgi:heterotetrameric sarcosine oxidase gamma subunit